jgi:hypothetical protein
MSSRALHSSTRSPNSVFWGEMAPCAHSVQIYGNDAVFLEMLSQFVVAGMRHGEAAIVIATPEHVGELTVRLEGHGIDVAAAQADDRLVVCGAEDTLAQFMVAGMPDEARFEAAVRALMERARGPGKRKVRAFGEMVALLWERRAYAATVRLEQLWSGLCEAQRFELFCAYPRDVFPKNAAESISEICRLHSRVVTA